MEFVALIFLAMLIGAFMLFSDRWRKGGWRVGRRGSEEAQISRNIPDWRTMPAGGRRGRGPKNYRRSDQRIVEDINDRLLESPVDASEVAVQCKDGIVTLTGSVEDRDAKRMVEFIADSVPGVIDVNNQLVLTGTRPMAA